MNTMGPCLPNLLIRPNPERTEGPKGYQLRLAEANCMTMRDFEVTGFSYDPSWLADQHLLPAEALDPALHLYVTRLAKLLRDSGRIWNHRFVRYCPKCLAEVPVWRVGWEILFHDVCPRHGVWLVDQCGSCRQPVTWHRDSLLRCQCGSDLREECCSSAPNGTRKLSAILEARVLNRDLAEEFQLLAGLDVEQIQRLVRYLGSYMDPVSGPKPLKLRNAGSMQASWPISSLAAEIIAQWPHGFQKCWTRMQEDATGEKAGLNQMFQQAYYYLYKGLDGKAFQPVREAFETWLGEHWKGTLSKRNRRLTAQLLANAQWVPGKVAANQLGISVSRLRSLVKEGLVDGQESISPQTGRRFLVVRRDQLEAVGAQLASEISMTAATEQLGIGKVRMRRLLRLLFPGARRTNDRSGMPWCVPRAEVEALLSLGSNLPIVCIPDEDQVSLAHVLKYWTWTAEEIIHLLEAVRGETVNPSSILESVRGIGGWVFGAARLRAWQSSLGSGPVCWLSIPEVAEVLSVKQEVAYWLTQNDFIPASEKLGNSKRGGKRVRREDVVAFRQSCIFGTELAASVGRSSRKVARLLAERGIYPLRGHTLRPCRQLVYLRTEALRRFLMELTGNPTGKGLEFFVLNG